MKKGDKWRFWVFGLMIVASFSVLVVALANLQIRGADDYGAIAESSMTKTISEAGTRGQILDVNGVVMATDKKIYNVNFYRSPSSDSARNERYSRAIWEVIKLLDRDDKMRSLPFWLAQDEEGVWYFDTRTEDEGVATARENMFRSNFYVKNVDTQDIYERLCTNYGIHKIDKDYTDEADKLTTEDKLRVLAVWQEMQMNAFNSTPITIATDIPWGTVIEIETRLINLDGISISVENQRVYPKGTLACHILGYTGLMQQESTVQEYLARGYLRNDRIGQDGIEQSMEHYLTGNSSLRRGTSIVEVDRTGRQIRTLSKTDATDGNTVKLTIDASMQSVVETELDTLLTYIRVIEEGKLADPDWLETNKEELLNYQAREQAIKLAQNGAIVVLDMNCRVLGMASYPNYDPNLFILGMNDEEAYRMLEDDRKPLFNNAISARDTPGSVFKMCTALAALSTGNLSVTETITDEGYFREYDKSSTAPKCWVSESRRGTHANLTVVGGIAKSCNYFFYTIASWMGEDGEVLHQFAAKMGLTSKTNIDLPGEVKSVVGNQTTLYDPNKPITGTDQATWLPYQIKNQLKAHLKMCGETYNITYSDERLDKCVKALMDMAVVTSQGTQSENWVRAIRPILMEELGMSREMVYMAFIISETTAILNQIKWGGSQTIQTAIGQSITLTTPVAMARYLAAIGNGGYVYDVQIIDSIISPEGDVIQSFDEPVLVNDLSDEIGEYLPKILEGMKGVVDESGTAASYFANWDLTPHVAGKTGTAEKSKLDVESNSWFVALYPIEAPEIAIAVYVPYGLSGGYSSTAAKAIIQYYEDSKVDAASLILPAPNALAQ